MTLDQLSQFMEAIASVESGGSYSAQGPRITNPNSRYYGERAYGKYQIMPGNWDAWAREAGIPGANIRDPAAQDRVARYKFTQYYQRYGSWALAAVAWFAGGGTADRASKNGIDTLAEVTDQLGTSVPTYVAKVIANLEAGGVDTTDPYTPDPVQLATATSPASPEMPRSTNDGLDPGAVLTMGLESLSNTIAGGQRMSLDDAVSQVQRIDDTGDV